MVLTGTVPVSSSNAAACQGLHALLLGVAVVADSVQFHLVSGQSHAEIARDNILHALDRGVFEFYDPAASLADEMIVMTLSHCFVARLAFVEVSLVEQRAFFEQAQRPVNRRVADVRIDLLDLGVQFLGADVMPVIEEYARDVVALAGRLEPALLEASVEGEHPLFRADRGFAIDYGVPSRRAFGEPRHLGTQVEASPR